MTDDERARLVDKYRRWQFHMDEFGPDTDLAGGAANALEADGVALKAAQAEIVRLREALEHFGTHDDSCQSMQVQRSSIKAFGPSLSCDCGFEALDV